MCRRRLTLLAPRPQPRPASLARIDPHALEEMGNESLTGVNYIERRITHTGLGCLEVDQRLSKIELRLYSVAVPRHHTRSLRDIQARNTRFHYGGKKTLGTRHLLHRLSWGDRVASRNLHLCREGAATHAHVAQPRPLLGVQLEWQKAVVGSATVEAVAGHPRWLGLSPRETLPLGEHALARAARRVVRTPGCQALAPPRGA